MKKGEERERERKTAGNALFPPRKDVMRSCQALGTPKLVFDAVR